MWRVRYLCVPLYVSVIVRHHMNESRTGTIIVFTNGKFVALCFRASQILYFLRLSDRLSAVGSILAVS